MNDLDRLIGKTIEKISSEDGGWTINFTDGTKSVLINIPVLPDTENKFNARQEDIRNYFGVGQTVLVRMGKDWVSRQILKITVFRNDDTNVLGTPRFWFKDYGNIPLEEIMAKEDIDPNLIKKNNPV